MKALVACLSIALFASTSAYAADTKFLKSTPADGSVSDAPPTSFAFEFSEAVRFHQAFIKKDGDKEKPIGNLPSKDAATLTIPAPSLNAGSYVLEWSVFTRQSKALSGRIRFTVGSTSGSSS